MEDEMTVDEMPVDKMAFRYKAEHQIQNFKHLSGQSILPIVTKM